MLTIALSFFLNACNKTKTEKQITSEEQKEKEAFAALQERYKNVSKGFTVETNEKLKTMVALENGPVISWEKYQQLNPRSNTLQVPDDCNEAPESTILNTSLVFDCATGEYKLSAKFRILLDAQVLTQSPTNANNKTVGRVRIMDGNTQVDPTTGYHQYNIAASDIVYIKESLNNGGVPCNEYEVSFSATFTYAQVPQLSGTNFRLSLRYYTICGGQAYVTSEGSPFYTANIESDPCKRNDKVWINPAYSGMYAAIAGTNGLLGQGPVCNWPNYVNPCTHEISIYDITNGSYTLVGQETLLNTGFKSLSYLQVGKKYRFEYNNRKNQTCDFGAPPQYGTLSCRTPFKTIEDWQF